MKNKNVFVLLAKSKIFKGSSISTYQFTRQIYGNQFSIYVTTYKHVLIIKLDISWCHLQNKKIYDLKLKIKNRVVLKDNAMMATYVYNLTFTFYYSILYNKVKWSIYLMMNLNTLNKTSTIHL